MSNIVDEMKSITYKAELNRLAEMLLKAEIPFEFDHTLSHIGGEDYSIYRIGYPNKTNKICSVVQGQFTYGGSEGLLEIMGLLTDEEREYDEVVGYLTAEEVFKRIKQDYESRLMKGERASESTFARAAREFNERQIRDMEERIEELKKVTLPKDFTFTVGKYESPVGGCSIFDERDIHNIRLREALSLLKGHCESCPTCTDCQLRPVLNCKLGISENPINWNLKEFED